MGLFIASERSPMAISQDEREFFVALGSRIARLRKQSHLTQVQLAQTLGVGLEELIGGQSHVAAKKRGPAPKLQQHMERISQLPKTQQRFVMQMLETVLAQASR
jgi:transcriptional regulator with XRE-family HTH domain